MDESRKTQLIGKKVLIVEDSALLALDLSRILSQRGAEVLGPALSLDKARKLIGDQTPQCAVLDINLRGTMVFEFAEELRAKNIPFVFVTGYDGGSVPDGMRAVPCLEKPLEEKLLIRTLDLLLST